MESYQAIFDAVRSRISNGDVGNAIQEHLRDLNLGHYTQQALHSFEWYLADCKAPHVLMKPAIYIDGNQWCALYGENIQDGVCGFGDSPAKAMEDFDRNWAAALKG